jgi:hypothetical protein
VVSLFTTYTVSYYFGYRGHFLNEIAIYRRIYM